MAQFEASATGLEVVAAFNDRVKGKTIIITGPSEGGIGAETAISLASAAPAHIILLGRSLPKINPVIDRIHSIDPDINVNFIPLDLSSQASIRKAAAQVNKSVGKIDILINNAGIMVSPWAKTEDGIESQFATNHVAHFLLTNLLMEKILAAGEGARIVNVSSGGHRFANVRLDDYNFKDGAVYNATEAYGQAKTANILFSVALASKFPPSKIAAFSLHPGSIRTNLQVHMTPELKEDMLEMALKNTGRPYSGGKFQGPKSLQQGCSTTLVAALDPSISELSGSYLEGCSVTQPESYALDKETAEQLWELSEKLVGQEFVL